MIIKLLTSRTSNVGPAQQWGDVIEVSDDEGKRLIAAGQAMAVEQIETAMQVGGENAALNTRNHKRRN